MAIKIALAGNPNCGKTTMFLTTNLKYSYLSSTIVREVAAFGGDISQFVPETVAKSIKEKMSQ